MNTYFDPTKFVDAPADGVVPIARCASLREALRELELAQDDIVPVPYAFQSHPDAAGCTVRRAEMAEALREHLKAKAFEYAMEAARMCRDGREFAAEVFLRSEWGDDVVVSQGIVIVGEVRVTWGPDVDDKFHM